MYISIILMRSFTLLCILVILHSILRHVVFFPITISCLKNLATLFVVLPGDHT